VVSRSYRVSVESGLSWAVGALACITATSWVLVSVPARHQIGPWLWGAIATSLTVSAAIGWRGARLRLGNWDVTAMAVASVAIQLGWASGPQAPITAGQRCMATTLVAFGAFAFASRATRVAAISASVAAQLGADWIIIGPLDAVEGLWPVVAAGVVAAVCISMLREAGRNADEASALQRRASVDSAREAARRRAHRDIQGVLHDDVVAALRAASLPEVSWAEARQAATDALAAIERWPAASDDHAPVDLSQLVRDLAPVPQTVTTFRVGRELLVPADVARAVTAATAEVLRNVARHAHAHRVQVTLERDGDGFALAIDDDGIGFRPASAMNRSHGLRYSVARRIEDVGGRADIDSSPGRGTTVRLAWQSTPALAPRTHTRAERMAAAVGNLRRPLAAMCLPYLAMSGIFAVRYATNGRLPWWMLVWFVGLCAITLRTVDRVRTGLSGRTVAGALGYGVAGTIASLFVLPPGALHGYASWSLGATAPLLATVILVRPAWEAVTALIAIHIALAVTALSGHFDPGPWSGQLIAEIPPALSTVTPVVLGLVLGRAILRLGDAVTRANDDIRAQATTESARIARQSLRQRRLAAMNEEILPFLRSIATSESAGGGAETRDSARALEYAARDELHLPGVLDGTAREQLRRARAGGCIIAIQTSGAQIPSPGLVRDMLVTALGAGGVPRELTLSVQTSGLGSTVNLVTVPGDDSRATALEHAFGDAMSTLDSTPEATWAELPLRAGVAA
jgi:anti-sigma regulatory factor (Ser/Thr protein kinase)